MNLISVEIENFGSIKDRQCIKLNKGITTLIGLNESGKTTILNAISKLNGEAIEDDGILGTELIVQIVPFIQKTLFYLFLER